MLTTNPSRMILFNYSQWGGGVFRRVTVVQW